MSIRIKYEGITDTAIRRLNKDLVIQPTVDNMPPIITYHRTSDSNSLLIPLGYAVNQGFSGRRTAEFSRISSGMFEGELRAEQIAVRKESVNHLSEKSAVIISLPTGGGKTITSIALACNIRLQTLVIVNKIVLANQWKESIHKFAPRATVHMLSPQKSYRDTNADFYIVNAINVPKFNLEFLRQFGLVILDEVHNLVSQILFQALHYLEPRYLIGLSATPYRTDDCNALLDLYFGKRRVVRLMHKHHEVFVVKTPFQPEVKKGANGRLDWSVVLDSLARNEERNKFIVSIVLGRPDRNFMIITKRIYQVRKLERLLQEEGVSVTTLCGSNQKYDESARVLIGTNAKMGTGMDCPKYDTLILATDVSAYFIQTLGRIFRRLDSTPIVFDIVDDHIVLWKHYEKRKEVYKAIGGTIRKYVAPE